MNPIGYIVDRDSARQCATRIKKLGPQWRKMLSYWQRTDAEHVLLLAVTKRGDPLTWLAYNDTELLGAVHAARRRLNDGECRWCIHLTPDSSADKLVRGALALDAFAQEAA